MAAVNQGIEITNLRQFRADLKAAAFASQRQLTKGLKDAGAPIVIGAAALAPVGTGKGDTHKGALRAGYTTRVRGATAAVVNRVPYGGGAEWGQRGKWKGFKRATAVGLTLDHSAPAK